MALLLEGATIAPEMEQRKAKQNAADEASRTSRGPSTRKLLFCKRSRLDLTAGPIGHYSIMQYLLVTESWNQSSTKVDDLFPQFGARKGVSSLIELPIVTET